jgi:hypothetical protein
VTRWKKTSGILVPAVALLLLATPSSITATEKTITLKGRVDVSGLNASPGRFTVRALMPQKRSIELGRTTTDRQGRFRLRVRSEPVGIFGVVLEATSEKDPTLGLEANVLRLKEAKKPIPINAATTVEAAILYWKIRRHLRDFDLIRPYLLYQWIRPALLPKTRKGLERAEVALVKWAQGAGAEGFWPAAIVMRACVGDLRQMRKRLTALKVPSKDIEKVEEMVRTDAEVAYILMMPYLLEL